jgi:simple sugar transport system permease protein
MTRLRLLALRALPIVWAALLAMVLASVLTRLYGQSPLQVYRLLWAGTWGSSYGIGQVLFKSTPLLFTGLAVAVALRAGLFNVGGEGQIITGALCTALCGAALPAGTPAALAIPLALACGFAGGAAVGAVPGLLKWWAGAHEVIVTILLNFIVRALLIGASARLFVKESVHTPAVIDAAQLSRLSRWVPALHGSAVNTALLLGLGVVLLLALLLDRTRFGFALRTVGQNPDAGQAAGLHLGRVRTLALLLSGGIAGLGGANFVLGYKHYYEDGFSSGVGYLGIAVAVLGQSRPLGVLLAALLFGTLSQGGLAVNALCPRELMDVLSAVMILAVATATPEVRRLIARLPLPLSLARPRAESAPPPERPQQNGPPSRSAPSADASELPLGSLGLSLPPSRNTGAAPPLKAPC